jgi:hypothetical protein
MYCAALIVWVSFSQSGVFADDRASEEQIAAMMATCKPGAFAQMASSLSAPEQRYRVAQVKPPPSIADKITDKISLIPDMIREQFFRWYDFSQLINDKRYALGLGRGEYEQIVEKSRNKKGGDKAIFWYPHWENGFTHPQHFRLGRPFQFLVHAVSDWGKGLILMAHPEVLNTLELSTSLIDQDNFETYGSSGFILEVHPDHVYATAPRNMARNEDRASTMNYFHPLREPREIFLAAQGRMNEVVLSSTRSEYKIKIIGLFIHARVNGNPWPVHSQRRVERMKELCTQMRIPVVGLPVSRF